MMASPSSIALSAVNQQISGLSVPRAAVPPAPPSTSTDGNSGDGNTGNSTGITNIAINNVDIGTTYFDGNTITVDVFTIDVILTVVFDRYNYASVTVGSTTKTMPANGAKTTITFPGVKMY